LSLLEKHSVRSCLLGRGDVELSGNRFGHSCVHSTKLHRLCLSRLRRFGFVGHKRPRFKRRFCRSLSVRHCERLQVAKILNTSWAVKLWGLMS